MAEYIEREALLRNLSEDIEACGEEDSVCRPIAYGSILGLKMAVAYANTIPTADVVEVKHGEWFLLDECANEGVYCSVCRKKVYRTEYANQKIKSKFCPNCGAKMGKKEGDVE